MQLKENTIIDQNETIASFTQKRESLEEYWECTLNAATWTKSTPDNPFLWLPFLLSDPLE
eukprot:14594143-Ditylum_brightwellii.AAC.1